MGILNIIRQKPDNQKKIFSLITAIILTLVIVIVWFSFSNKPFDSETAVGESKLSSLSPLQVIKEEFSKAFANFNNQAPDIMSTTSTSTVEIEIVESATSTEGQKEELEEIATSTKDIN